MTVGLLIPDRSCHNVPKAHAKFAAGLDTNAPKLQHFAYRKDHFNIKVRFYA